jgi:hypothetical protein
VPPARDAAERAADMHEFVVYTVRVAMQAEQRLIGFDKPSDSCAAGGAEMLCPIAFSPAAVQPGSIGEGGIAWWKLDIEDVVVYLVQLAYLIL